MDTATERSGEAAPIERRIAVKQKFLIPAVLLTALAVCIVGYYEIHFQTTEWRAARLSDERILAEMPDLELTDRDLDFGEAVLSDPEVAEAMENEDGLDLPEASARRLFADALPENVELENISVFQNAVYCGYLEGEDKRVVMTFFKDNAYGPYKTIALYRGESCKALYENRAGELQKLEPHHRWFAYFRDRMWED